MHDEAGQEAGAREEVVGLLDVAVDEHVLPGHQHLVHDEDGVVLVEPARQRIVERTAHHRRAHLIGGAADELHARRVGRQHEHRGEFLVLHRDQSVVGDERVVGQHRAGGDHLGARDDETGVGLLLDVAADVADLVRRPVAIDRRMDDGVIDERHAFLAEFVPAPGVVLVRIVEIRRWRRASRETPPCSPASGPSSHRSCAPIRRWRRGRRSGPRSVFGALKKACVMPPLPVSVGSSSFFLRLSSCSASNSRATMRAVLRNAGWVVTSLTRSP